MPTEEQRFQARVVSLARELGWSIVRIPNRGQATAVFDNKGFPDLMLARPGRVLFIELKAQDGTLSDDQLLWANILKPNWFCFRPGDYDLVVETLVSRM